MSSYKADKKNEHEKKAKKSLKSEDHSQALFHLVKAAEFSLELAQEQDGKAAKRYMNEAKELREMAENISDKAQKEKKEKSKKSKNKQRKKDKEKEVEEEEEWLLTEKPDMSFDDVAGLSNVKDELKVKVIEPFTHPKIYERFKLQVGGGILMYGPPGTGKTLIARAVAGELEAKFFNIDAADIKDKYYGQTEQNLKSVFDSAKSFERSVIFLDEAESLLTKRGNRQRSKVTTFLSLADGLEENDNCLLLLAATNRPWMIDEAALRPGRFDTHIFVGLPDKTAREKIIELNMEDVPVSEEISFQEIAEKAEDYSGADLAQVTYRAKLSAARREKEKKTANPNAIEKVAQSEVSEKVTRHDFDRALDQVTPTVSEEEIDKIKDWEEKWT